MPRAGERCDQYYWITSALGERGIETRCCRLISVVVGAWGVLPTALLLAPAGPDTTFGCVSAVVSTAMAVTAAMIWARGRWPSRRQSAVLLVGLVLATGAVALQIEDAERMLYGVVAMTLLAVYSLTFHSARYLALTLVAALVVLAVVAERSAGRDGVLLAVCITIVSVSSTTVALLLCSTALRLLDLDARDRDRDAFTGTLTPQAFSRSVAEMVGARTRQSDSQLVITAVLLDDMTLLGATAGRASRERAQVAAAQTLRRNTRGSAVVARVDASTFALAEVFTSTQLGPYAHRLEGGLATNPPKTTFRIGIVHTPLRNVVGMSPDPLVDRLIDAAVVQARCHRPGGPIPSASWFPTTDEIGG